MVDMKALDQRLSDLETVVKTLILFNSNTTAVLGKRISAGNPAIADAIAADLAELKSLSYSDIDKDIYDNFVDSLTLGITGRA
ncbi:hypothetical protein ACYZT4_10560 [Pseudomonas sp. GB2N2]